MAGLKISGHRLISQKFFMVEHTKNGVLELNRMDRKEALPWNMMMMMMQESRCPKDAYLDKDLSFRRRSSAVTEPSTERAVSY